MKFIWRTIRFISLSFFIYTVLSAFVILFFRLIDPPVTAFINAKTDPLFGLFLFSDINQKSVKIQNVSKYAALAVIASEDQKFFEHFGFDFEQIEKAMKENELKKNMQKKRVRGASTVSMQVAKNILKRQQNIFYYSDYFDKYAWKWTQEYL